MTPGGPASPPDPQADGAGTGTGPGRVPGCKLGGAAAGVAGAPAIRQPPHRPRNRAHAPARPAIRDRLPRLRSQSPEIPSAPGAGPFMLGRLFFAHGFACCVAPRVVAAAPMPEPAPRRPGRLVRELFVPLCGYPDARWRAHGPRRAAPPVEHGADLARLQVAGIRLYRVGAVGARQPRIVWRHRRLRLRRHLDHRLLRAPAPPIRPSLRHHADRGCSERGCAKHRCALSWSSPAGATPCWCSARSVRLSAYC